jgi:DNA-binding transcriptional ArsR family regulator
MKSHSHPVIEEVEKTGIFYALGDSSRLQIVKNIYQAEQALTCMQAVEGIENLSVATRSNCFRILREAGLIRSEKQGRECFNSLRTNELEEKFPKLIETILA